MFLYNMDEHLVIITTKKKSQMMEVSEINGNGFIFP